MNELGVILEDIVEQHSNWGRWGVDDERGTLNLIQPECRVRAAGLVQTGETLSLALPLGRGGPIPPHDLRFNPIHTMLQTGVDFAAGRQAFASEGWGWADDIVTMPLQCSTQWDALSHIFHRGVMYNGRDCSLVGAAGAVVNAITSQSDAVAGRGVLIDLPRLHGVKWLPIDHYVTVPELDAALELQGTELLAGDIVLIRTGNMLRARQNGGWDRFTHDHEPGPGLDSIPWLHRHDVAAVASDTWSFEAIPSLTPTYLPFHVAAIVYLGLLVGEMFVLDELAHLCEARARWTFFLTAAPLPFEGGVGSPVNPLAVF